ncbi:MAG: hypothetical protein MI924_17660 [Chloroflexales bacterium]|nr:hypothetical protein [Chloroflexales bacterium]
MRVVIYSLPQHGHINPTLALTKELAERGHEVIYYMTEEFQEKIEKAGGIFRALGTHLDIYGEAQKAINNRKDTSGLVPADALGVFIQFMAETMTRLEYLGNNLTRDNPDLIIYDPMSLWGQILARRHNAPKATFYTTYPMVSGNAMSGSMATMFGKAITPRILSAALSLGWSLLKARFKYRNAPFSPRDLFTAKEALNLVPLPRGILPNAAELDDSYLFFGPNLMPSYSHKGESLPVPSGKRYLYVSMGSTALNNQPELFKSVIANFGNSNWHVVLNIGEANKESLSAAPPNIVVRNYVPQIEVIQQADVFLTHGGMNSVMESCYFGVPMIVFALQPETNITAHQIEAKRIGMSIQPTDLCGRRLREIADAVCDRTAFKENIRIIQDELKALGGARQACDEIEAYVK